MTLPHIAAAVMLVGLAIYALTGGADFGGGVWDLLARGRRAHAQREAIEHALAPVWEANHVWLIFVIVVLFTAFPPAFARIGTDLHVPITLMLIGIVLRGSAFVFRQYGGGTGQRRWGTVFAVSSVVAPLFLGIVLGAMVAGPPWWGAFPIAVGVLALAAFAALAAVYLTVELRDEALRGDFRHRFVGAAIAVAIAAIAAAIIGRFHAERFASGLLGSWWTGLLIGGAAIAWAIAIACSVRHRDRAARAAAIATVGLLVVGWGAAQYPVLVAPDITIANSASPHATLQVILPVMAAGTVVLLPSLWWLLRVFKTTGPHGPS